MSGMHFLTDREEERGDLLLPKSESGEGEPEVRKQVGWPAAFDTGSACSAPAVPPGFARWRGRGRGAAAWKDSFAADLTGCFPFQTLMLEFDFMGRGGGLIFEMRIFHSMTHFFFFFFIELIIRKK